MRLLSACCLALIAACTSADDAPPGDGTAVQAIAADPSTVGSFVACSDDAFVNGVDVQLYWPRNGGCGAAIYSPLVVFLPGFGYNIADYDSLLVHLAENGYIVVAIQEVPDFQGLAFYEASAELAWSVITDYVWTTWDKRFYIDPENVGLIGHSRGGEVIRHIAEDLKADPLFNVRAVVPIAPAYHNVMELDGANTTAALVLVGSSDEDTRAQSAYFVHDRAGSDASQQDPGLNTQAIYRSMKLLHGGDHEEFAVNFSDQSMVAQGYVVAFLHAHLKLDITYFEEYIRGDHIPHGWLAGVTSQYSDGFYRRVIDNFDDGQIANPTLVGAVLTMDPGAGGTLNLASSSTSPHATIAFRFTPPANHAGFEWSIPAGKRDATPFKYLSMRIGQSAGASTDDVRVRIVNGGNPSGWLRVTDYTLTGALPQPITMTEPAPLPYTPDAHMGTIRIPLGEFGAHDNVTSVEFKAQAEAVNGQYLIDNVEFSEWIFKP